MNSHRLWSCVGRQCCLYLILTSSGQPENCKHYNKSIHLQDNIPSTYSHALQTPQTCSLTKWHIMLHPMLVYAAPCSCAHCRIKSDHDRLLNPSLYAFWRTLLFEYWPLIRCPEHVWFQFENTNTVCRGPIDVLRTIYLHERGFRGLSTGMSATMLREIPGNACMFGVYEGLKIWMANLKARSTSKAVLVVLF